MGWIKELGDEMDKSKTVKFLVVTALVVFILAMVTLGFRLARDTYHGNDAVKVGGLEIPKSNPDTTHVSIVETTYTPIRVLPDSKIKPFPTAKNSNKSKSSSVPNNSMKIDSGGSGIQNNAPNYGNQAGRDLYVKDKSLDDSEIRDVFDVINYAKENFHINMIKLVLGPNSNGQKVFTQLNTELLKKGYSIDNNNLGYSYPLQPVRDKITYDTSGKTLSIVIGNF